MKKYERLQVTDHVDRWTVDKLRHVESGIIANEQAIENVASNFENFQTKGDYALKAEIPDVSNFQVKGNYALKEEIPDVSNFQVKGEYVLKTEMPDVSQFATHEEVQEMLNELEIPEGSGNNVIALTEDEIINICKI